MEISNGYQNEMRCDLFLGLWAVCFALAWYGMAEEEKSEIYAMHFPDVSSLPCPLEEDVRLYDSVTRVYNKILESSRTGSTFDAKLLDLHCLAGTDHYYSDAHTRISFSFFEVGAFEAAIQHCVLALSRNPYSPHCWNILQESYFRLGRFERTLFYADYVRISFPGHANICFNGSRIDMLFEKNLVEESIKTKFYAFKFLESLNQGAKVLTGNLINVVESETYLLGLEMESQEPSSANEESILSKCNMLFKERIHEIPNLSPGGSVDVSWSKTSPVKIFYPNQKGFQIPFAETTLALSEHLSLLGVPHKIVSIIQSSDPSLYIFLHGTPYSGIFDRLPKHYILWNFEKHPRISVEGIASSTASLHGDVYTNPGYIGFGVDPDTNTDQIVYPSSFIEGAVSIWEASLANMDWWEKAYTSSHFQVNATSTSSSSSLKPVIPLFWVPPLAPITDVERTCALAVPFMKSSSDDLLSEEDFGRYPKCNEHGSKSTRSCEQLSELDRPVDVLFFGDVSPYRRQVLQRLQVLASARGWNFQMFVRYDLLGTTKETLIQQAKVVLNLNTQETVAVADTSATGEPTTVTRLPLMPLNAHRIRSLLALGTAVVSERSGYSVEESQFRECVAFADSFDDLVNKIQSLLDDTRKRHKLQDAALAFSIRELGMRASTGLGEFWNLRLPAILESHIGLQRDEMTDDTLDFKSKLSAMPTSIIAFPPAMALFSNAMIRATEIYFAPCQESSGSKGCHERRFTIPRSSPSYIKEKVEASEPQETLESELEQAEMALLWVTWQQANRGALNPAFVYANSPTHYRGILRSRDAFHGLRRPEPVTTAGSTSSGRSLVMDVSILLGYLQRRFQFTGNYLRLGCIVADEKNSLLNMVAFDSYECINDEMPTFSTIANKNLSSVEYLQLVLKENENFVSEGNEHLRKEYELIFVDGHHSSALVEKQVDLAMQLVSASGFVLVTNARPRYKMEALYPNDGSFYWSGDVWKAVVKIAESNKFDMALADFDWGIVVMRKNRRGPPPLGSNQTKKPFNATEFSLPDFSPSTPFHGISYGELSWLDYAAETDKYLPLLSFTELHYWLL